MIYTSLKSFVDIWIHLVKHCAITTCNIILFLVYVLLVLFYTYCKKECKLYSCYAPVLKHCIMYKYEATQKCLTELFMQYAVWYNMCFQCTCTLYKIPFTCIISLKKSRIMSWLHNNKRFVNVENSYISQL